MSDERPDAVPDWLGGADPSGPPTPPDSPVAAAIEDAWSEHQLGRDGDEALPSELPGGAIWQDIYDEATASAGGDPRDLWNRLSEVERGRYATLAAVTRRHLREHSPDSPAVPDRNNPLPFISARELVAQTPPDVPWIVRHLFARGALTEIDGQAKRAGKSTLLGHAFRSILAGRDFLGWRTERTPIVLLTEMHDTPLRQLLERTRLVKEDDLRILRWTDARLVRWPDVVADAIAECHEHGAGLFVTDTLPQFAGIRGDSENDAGAALAAIEPLQAAAASGLAVAIVRHERKGGGVVGESGRGSTAFTGAVDIVVRLAQPLNPQRDTIRQLSILSRFDGAPADLMIELGDTGYEVLGEETKVAYSEALQAVLMSVSQTAGSVRETDIVSRTGKAKGTVGAALRELVDRGEIVRDGAGRAGSPFTYRRAGIGGEGLPTAIWETSPNGSGGLSPSRTPLTGEGSGAGETFRAAAGGSVGDRMAAILDEPEDVDEPDDAGDVIAAVFGNGVGPGRLS